MNENNETKKEEKTYAGKESKLILYPKDRKCDSEQCKCTIQ